MLATRLWTGAYWFLSFAIALFSLALYSVALGTEFGAVMPHLVHYFEHANLALMAHVVFAPIALIVAPFQFWQGLRQRNRRVHRVIGYTYVISIFVAAAGSLAMMPNFLGTTWAGTGFVLLAFLWIGTTWKAVNLARQGDYVNHRRWVMRSAALTSAAIVLRLLMLPLVASGWTILETYNVTAWASWLLPLIGVELWMRRQQANRLPGRPQQVA